MGNNVNGRAVRRGGGGVGMGPRRFVRFRRDGRQRGGSGAVFFSLGVRPLRCWSRRRAAPPGPAGSGALPGNSSGSRRAASSARCSCRGRAPLRESAPAQPGRWAGPPDDHNGVARAAGRHRRGSRPERDGAGAAGEGAGAGGGGRPVIGERQDLAIHMVLGPCPLKGLLQVRVGEMEAEQKGSDEEENPGHHDQGTFEKHKGAAP